MGLRLAPPANASGRGRWGVWTLRRTGL